jgi:hypothetical protein
MTTPSVKTIINRLGDTLKKEHGGNYLNVAKQIRVFMINANNEESVDNCLDEINTLLKGYGIEAIHDNKWERYYLSIGLLYVNMGDTYAQTIVYDTRTENFMVCSWGDIVEHNEKRFTV